MTIIRDVIAELFGMFVADWRLTVAVLALVAAVALMGRYLHPDALLQGGLLLGGCIVILVGGVVGAARERRRDG